MNVGVAGSYRFAPNWSAGLEFLASTGAVKDIETLDYRESYGDQVRGAAWRAQFAGKRNSAPLKLGADIKNVSGATLSSKHVTDGVRRLLATYAIVLAPHAA